MKKLNNFLNTLIGSFLGVFIGRGIYLYWDFKNHPDFYAMQSAPWYTSIFVYGAVTFAVVAAAAAAKIFIRKYTAKDEYAAHARGREDL